MRMLVIFVLLITFLANVVRAEEYCFDKEQASRIVIELEQKRLLENEIREYEGLVANLKKQNELLQKQNELLQEELKILKNQVELYKIAYEEEKKKSNVTLFEKGKWLGIGIIIGIILKVWGL